MPALLGGAFLIFHVLFASKPDYPDSRTEALEDIFYYAVVNRVDSCSLGKADVAPFPSVPGDMASRAWAQGLRADEENTDRVLRQYAYFNRE